MDTTNKPKTISTIDINLHMPKVSQREWLETAMEDHLQCVLCGSALTFAHKTDFILGTVAEDAHCPGCRVRNRQSLHTLQ